MLMALMVNVAAICDCGSGKYLNLKTITFRPLNRRRHLTIHFLYKSKILEIIHEFTQWPHERKEWH